MRSHPSAGQQQLRQCCASAQRPGNRSQRAAVLKPWGQDRRRPASAARRRCMSGDNAAILSAPSSFMRAKQNAGHQQPEIFIEMLAHAFELRLIERACGMQAARQATATSGRGSAACPRSNRPACASVDRQEPARARRRPRTDRLPHAPKRAAPPPHSSGAHPSAHEIGSRAGGDRQLIREP